MTKPTLTIALLLALAFGAAAQPCTPAGNQLAFGTGNTWIGYVYDNMDFTGYMGYVNEGSAGSPNFDQSFGGANVSYATNGCPVNTNTFSVRYKLQRNFTAGSYVITIGGDDGYRLSVDGGSTWLINRWADQSYVTTAATVTLSGTVSLVLEYYENGSDNRISFNLAGPCSAADDQTIYGTSNTWNGYVYDGISFDSYAGRVNEGSGASPNFDQSFGGSNNSYSTSGCSVQTETFSVRYRLRKTFTNRSVSFTVGADDGFRLSIDGGANWLINRWVLQSYTTATSTVTLNGTYDFVLEYYENSGDNRISFQLVENVVLPLQLTRFTAVKNNRGVQLGWNISTDNETISVEPQRSSNGRDFASLSQVNSPLPLPASWEAGYTDATPINNRTWYRLQITGTGGKISYSSVIAVDAESANQETVNIYPTLVSTGGQLTLQSGAAIADATLLIQDASGRKAVTEKLGNITRGQVTSISLQKYRLATGLHLVSITGGDGSTTTTKVFIR